MKKFLLLYIFLCIFLPRLEANDSIVINGNYDNKFKLKIYEPIHGYYNDFFLDSTEHFQKLKFKNNSFSFNSSLTTPATYQIFITDNDDNFFTKSVLLLGPGDSLNLHINYDSGNINYQGSNAMGHKLFNDLDYNSVEKYNAIIDLFRTKKVTKEKLYNVVEKSVNTISNRFDSLNKSSLITPWFNSFAKTSYTLLLYHFTVNNILYKNSRNLFTKFERDEMVEHYYKKLPVDVGNDLQLSYNAILYFINYYKYLVYKKEDLDFIEALDKPYNFALNDTLTEVGNECGQFLRYENRKVGEDHWAIFMLILMNHTEPNTFEKEINQFKLIFPNSKWTNYLVKKEIQQSSSPITEYRLFTPIEFIKPTDKIFKLDDVFRYLPHGKPIMVDLWATWCGPCIKAFKYNSALDSYLLKNNITKLYVSLDNPNASKVWENSIDKYRLGGHHIMANKDLVANIKEVCGIGIDEPIGIPRYLLIDANHKVVVNDAIGPTTMKAFLSEIEKFILPKSK